jgi:hypothetical protein
VMSAHERILARPNQEPLPVVRWHVVHEHPLLPRTVETSNLTEP